jgi:hypothetical protein
MAFRRMPTFLANIPLRMLPLAEEQLAQLRETGWLREVAFRTQPNVNKVLLSTAGRQLFAPSLCHAVPCQKQAGLMRCLEHARMKQCGLRVHSMHSASCHRCLPLLRLRVCKHLWRHSRHSREGVDATVPDPLPQPCAAASRRTSTPHNPARAAACRLKSSGSSRQYMAWRWNE